MTQHSNCLVLLLDGDIFPRIVTVSCSVLYILGYLIETCLSQIMFMALRILFEWHCIFSGRVILSVAVRSLIIYWLLVLPKSFYEYGIECKSSVTCKEWDRSSIKTLQEGITCRWVLISRFRNLLPTSLISCELSNCVQSQNVFLCFF